MPSTVVEAPSVSVPDVPAIATIAARPDWPGYFGAPRYATADLGRRSLEAMHDWLEPMALRILDGAADERTITRMSAAAQDPVFMKILEPARRRDAAMATRQQEWLAARGR